MQCCSHCDCALITEYLFSYVLLLRLLISGCFFFFFKQKTAYEMRISDWSSDVCSSDLLVARVLHRRQLADQVALRQAFTFHQMQHHLEILLRIEIGRASCRERVCQYV